MAELISSKSTSAALHSSPTRKRTRESNLAAASVAATAAATPTYKATYQPITHSTSDYLHATYKAAATLASDEPSSFVAIEASSTSAAVPLTQARNSIRCGSTNGTSFSSSLPATAKPATTNGLTNGGHASTNGVGGTVIDNRTQYAVSRFSLPLGTNYDRHACNRTMHGFCAVPPFRF